MPQRLAMEGETLITYRFRTGRIGLASPGEISAARQIRGRRSYPHGSVPWNSVSILRSRPPCAYPGAHLRINSVPAAIAREFGVGSVEDVTFVALHASACLHGDAIRFGNGRHLLLERFREESLFRCLPMVPTSGPRPRTLGTLPTMWTRDRFVRWCRRSRRLTVTFRRRPAPVRGRVLGRPLFLAVIPVFCRTVCSA